MERTVTTLLYDGKYDGPQMSILVGEGCQMYVISRKDLKFISSHDEMKKPALYVLIGSENRSPEAYIGQTDDFSLRIKDHDYKKPFWTIALAFMREGSPMTSNEIKYLEYLGYKAVSDAGNYSTGENKQTIKEPTVNQREKSPIRSFFEKCVFLSDFRGYHVFTKTDVPTPPRPAKPTKPDKVFHMFTFERNGCKACGYIDGDDFVVAKGSRIDPSVTKSLTERHKDQERQKILDSDATLVDGVYVLVRDVRFKSANKAGMFCAAGSINALRAWKDGDNRPLGDFIRDKEQS